MIPLCTLHQTDSASAVFCVDDHLLRIQAVTPSLLRVTYTGREEFRLMDNDMLEELPASSLTVTEQSDACLLDAGNIQLSVSRQGGVLRFLHGDELLLQEPGPRARHLRPIDVIVKDYDPNAPRVETMSVDGVRIRADGKPRMDRKAYTVVQKLSFQDGEAIYGLGQHENGVLNYRGSHQLLYQHNLKVSCPVLMSSKGWGMLVNCQSAMTFHDDLFGTFISMDTMEELDYFIGYGPELDDLVGMVRLLTGDAPLLPRWSFGYVQSKEHYHTQQELIDVAKEYRERQIPLDCVVQDWLTWPKGQWGEKTPDPTRYPDLEGLFSELHDMNVHALWSVWPTHSGKGPNQLELQARGQMLGNGSTYNAFDPAARATYWEQLERGVFRYGLDGWWCDCTEPFERDWMALPGQIPEDRMAINVAEFKDYIDPAKINAYSLYHSKGIYENQRAYCDDRRVINLTRSGFPGQQKYGTITWNGDTPARWDVLAKSIPDGLNFCLSGQPYWTQDIGAFFVQRGKEWFRDADFDEGADDLGYRELYLRWMQLGCFLPMMRSHGTNTPREVWQFGKPGEKIYDALVDTIRLRYQLLPYIYTLAGQVMLQRKTMLRMLAFDYRHDPIALNVKDQFLLGSGLMVCPILFPIEYMEGSAKVPNPPKTRAVYLPEGKRWADFYTGQRYEGGQWIDVPVQLDRIPVFVPEGTVLPMGIDRQYADENPNAPVTLRVYAGQDGEGAFYNDAGNGYDYEKGEYFLANFRWDDAARKLHTQESGDPRFRPERFDIQIV